MRKIARNFIILALLCVILLPAFTSGTPAQKQEEGMAKKITIMIHPTLYLATGGETGVITQFTKDTGTEVEVVKIDHPERVSMNQIISTLLLSVK